MFYCKKYKYKRRR